MTRQTRLVVILLAIAIVGITTLSLVANQYQKRFASGRIPAAATDAAPAPEDADPESRAARLVTQFLAVRAAEKVFIAQSPVKIEMIVATLTGNFESTGGKRMTPSFDILGGYRQARFDALSAAGMSTADYVTTRAAFLAWLSGSPVSDPALGRALAARADEARAASLGATEALDAAVK